MKYQKGDYIDEYKVLLPLKKNNDMEIYRVRGGDGLLYALKLGANENEKRVAPLSGLYIASGSDYVVYRYLSGETLEARLSRERKCSADEVKRFAIGLLGQIRNMHDGGYAHSGISESNIMIDLGGGEATAWIVGLSAATRSDKISVCMDIQSIGMIMYHMALGEIPKMPLRIRVHGDDVVEERLLNIIYKAIGAEFSSAKEMLDAIEGRSEVAPMNKPLGEGFSAVAGMNEIKQRLQEDVIDILADRERAKLYGIDIPNGMLLYGPPGCGKTFIAEKFAEQASYHYYYIKASDLASTYLHGTQEKIASLFDEARKNAPSILCFDEFDALVRSRDGINNASQSGEVNEFLSQLNNCGSDGVFVIATTNRPDKIDSAVLRTGRIDYLVYVPMPDNKARRAMFYLALRNKPVDSDIDYEYLAEKTKGYLTSDISAIVSEAARIAFKLKSTISMSILKEALKTRMPSLSKDTVEEYERLRQKFENQRKNGERKRIGFIQ